mmetsp:Transcript_25279/g.66257  ORF Transcript_25279/g.66257 Transcript_25279/m.66257 type:complete len:208 (+) Transcript_25279:54-677(+)
MLFHGVLCQGLELYSVPGGATARRVRGKLVQNFGSGISWIGWVMVQLRLREQSRLRLFHCSVVVHPSIARIKTSLLGAIHCPAWCRCHIVLGKEGLSLGNEVVIALVVDPRVPSAIDLVAAVRDQHNAAMLMLASHFVVLFQIVTTQDALGEGLHLLVPRHIAHLHGGGFGLPTESDRLNFDEIWVSDLYETRIFGRVRHVLSLDQG